MKIKGCLILILLGISIHVSAWRIEGEYLFLEKGDNIWQVAYSLTGDGGNWKELWATRIDTTINNPFHAYPNMKFKLKSEIFLWNHASRTNIIKLDSTLLIVNNPTKIQESVVKSEVKPESRILGMDYGFARILIPVLVTLIVFLLGQFINWIKGKYERVNELKSIKATIEHWILFVELPVNTQIKGCDNFIADLKKSTDLQPERFQFSSMLVDKLQQIELKELIETIMLNLKGNEESKAKMIFNIISQVEFLVKIESQIQENYNKFHSYTYELMENWNDTFTNFNTIANDTSNQINEVEPNCEFVQSKNNIFNAFLSPKKTKSFDEIFTELVYPLEIEVDKYLKSSPNKQLIVNLAYSVEALKIIKLKWDTHKEGHIKMAEGFKTKINDVYGVLKSVATDLKDSEFKPIYQIK